MADAVRPGRPVDPGATACRAGRLPFPPPHPRAVVARTLICLIGALVTAVADNAATVATVGPFDGAFLLRVLVRFAALLALFSAGSLLMDRVPGAGPLARRSARIGERARARIRAALTSAMPMTAASACWSGLSRLPARARTPLAGLALTAAMAACWSPYMIRLYPGMIWYDTGDEIAQFHGIAALGQPAGVISAHHPVLDTLIFGWSTQLGEAWFGDYRAGMTLLVMVQCLAMCAILAACVLVVRRAGAPAGACAALFAFLALFPASPVFFMSAVKDSVHMVFFVPWLLMYVEACRTRLGALRSAVFDAAFLALAVLSALTTATGFYVVALSMLGLVFAGVFERRGVRRAIALRGVAAALAVAAILASHVAFPALVASRWRIHKEDANQILVVPMQMTARYVLDHPGEVTPGERAVIDRINVVPVERMAEVYNPYLADNVIHLSLRDPSALSDYLRVWAAQGQRDPMSYVDAFAALESGWFALERTSSFELGPLSLDRLRALADRPIANRMLMLDADGVISPSMSRMPPYELNADAQRSVAVDLWNAVGNMPVVGWLTYTAVWAFLLPLFLLFCAVSRPRRRAGGVADAARTGGATDVPPDARPSGLAHLMLAAMPMVWSLLALLANAISVPLKPTASRYILWALIVVPVYLALLRADRVRGAGPTATRESDRNGRADA